MWEVLKAIIAEIAIQLLKVLPEFLDLDGVLR